MTTTPVPRLVVLDVNETLSDMAPMRNRFRAAGAPPQLAELWFAAVLRDGIATTAAGGYADFGELARDEAQALLAALPVPPADPDAAAADIVAGFAELAPQPDVADGLRALRAAGFRLATLSNGPAATAERLLAAAGVAHLVEANLSVRNVGRWKPAPAAYQYVTERLGVPAEETLLAAVHPWDIDGAVRAGFEGAWIRRGRAGYPRALSPPTVVAEDLRQLPGALAEAA
jgi:2-haloacid dehalogenase